MYQKNQTRVKKDRKSQLFLSSDPVSRLRYHNKYIQRCLFLSFLTFREINFFINFLFSSFLFLSYFSSIFRVLLGLLLGFEQTGNHYEDLSKIPNLSGGRISEKMSCEESSIFFEDLAYISHIGLISGSCHIRCTEIVVKLGIFVFF